MLALPRSYPLHYSCSTVQSKPLSSPVPQQVAQSTAGTPRYARGVLDNWLHYFIRKRGMATPEGVSSGADIWAMYAEYTVGGTVVYNTL